MIILDFFKDSHRQALSYQLDEYQSQFSALPSRWFDETRSDICKVVLLDDGQAVGFFVLDGGQDKYQYTDNPKALLLRSMSINPVYQGRGYAKHALAWLVDFCHQHLSGFDEVVLGVNYNNINAQQVYEKSGFLKTNRIFMGRSGEQWIYELSLVVD